MTNQLHDLSEAWKKFNNGDSINDEELEELLEQGHAAYPFLRDRGLEFSLATRVLVHDLALLEGYKRARARNEAKK